MDPVLALNLTTQSIQMLLQLQTLASKAFEENRTLTDEEVAPFRALIESARQRHLAAQARAEAEGR